MCFRYWDLVAIIKLQTFSHIIKNGAVIVTRQTSSAVVNDCCSKTIHSSYTSMFCSFRLNLCKMSLNAEPERTLMHDGLLPSLPLPDLEQTCSKYLLSVKPVLTEDEYRQTEFVVDTFRSGVGKILQQKLKERAKVKENWLAEWWNDAYMEYRGPLPFFCNIGGYSDYSEIWEPKCGTQVYKMSIILFELLQKHLKIQREEWPVSKLKKNIPMDMHLYYNLFASSRMPGIEKDYLLNYTMKDGKPFCEMRNVIVIKNKRFFMFDALTENYEVLTQPELEMQFHRINAMAESKPDGPGVGSLTSIDRPTWKKIQDYLIALDSKNMDIIDIINKSLLICVLDEAEPNSVSETISESILGDSGNRWYDKGCQLIVYKNGYNGNNMDHAQLDGFMCCDVFEHVRDEVIKCKGKWTGTTKIRELPKPIELEFYVDDYILKEIDLARRKHDAMRHQAFLIDEPINNYGKQFAKDVSIHPDALIQMAIQLAYYRIHKKCVPTYETATTRQFEYGRTETLRVLTLETKQFVEAMDCDEIGVATRIRLLKQACTLHSKMMDQCCDGQGIDRHFLGLRKVAEAEGIELPMIFVDKAWKRSGGDGNFVLSTSLSGYRSVHGGMGPMTLDGYGIFYTMENDRIHIVVGTFGDDGKRCRKIRHLIEKSFSDFRKMLTNSKL